MYNYYKDFFLGSDTISKKLFASAASVSWISAPPAPHSSGIRVATKVYLGLKTAKHAQTCMECRVRVQYSDFIGAFFWVKQRSLKPLVRKIFWDNLFKCLPSIVCRYSLF